MAFSIGVSSGSEEHNLHQIMDSRKRIRMTSNRESARRSRIRKQKHLDDLATQVAQIRDENNRIIANISVTCQLYLHLEAENSVLRAQMAELSTRLEPLREIISLHGSEEAQKEVNGGLVNAWSAQFLNQATMASADMLMC